MEHLTRHDDQTHAPARGDDALFARVLDASEDAMLTSDLLELAAQSPGSPPTQERLVHDLRGSIAVAGSLIRQVLDGPDGSVPSRVELLTLAAKCVDQASRMLEDATTHGSPR